MEFGVVLQPNPPATGVVEMMKRAEAAGFGYGWTFDSHVLWQETFVLYPRILAETSSMVIGPMVTNPGTRDWSVIASMFATLNDTYGNRTICGIGRGDSARRYIGQAPVTLATLSDAMAVIKGLAALTQPAFVTVHTDSRYVLDGATQWLRRWKANGWKTADKSPVKNDDLWRLLEVEMARHDMRWIWVRGHDGHAENERADALARGAIPAR